MKRKKPAWKAALPGRLFNGILRYDRQKLFQSPDLVIDPQVIGPGQGLGIEPAAGQPRVVGPLDIAGKGISDDQGVVRVQFGDNPEHIVEIFPAGLATADVLGEKRKR